MEYAEKVALECLSVTEEISLQIGKRFEKFTISEMVLDENGVPNNNKKNNFKSINETGDIGVYAFEDPNAVIRYIGQGGRGRKTPLKSRISQELRLFEKTKNGNNGGTLSKNIQEIDSIEFNTKLEWQTFISTWKIRVISQSNWNISINVIEAFLIEVIDPRYNLNK